MTGILYCMKYKCIEHPNFVQSGALHNLTNLDRVSILAEALPYMQRFAGKTIVVKYGGAAMKDPALKVRYEAMLKC